VTIRLVVVTCLLVVIIDDRPSVLHLYGDIKPEVAFSPCYRVYIRSSKRPANILLAW